VNKQTVRLVDASGKQIGLAQVVEDGDQYTGIIDLGQMPRHLRAVFDEFEEVVNGQMFSFLGEIQGKVAALPIKAVFDNGCEIRIQDLQIFPTGGGVSFRVAEVPARTG
jgi:hypothetical protein